MNSLKKLIKKAVKAISTNKRLVILVGILIVGAVSSTLVVQEERRVERLWEEMREKEAEVERLTELASAYPDYRDLLYRLAVLQWELGNKQAAEEALGRARYLDPNNERVKLLYMSLGLKE